MRWRPYNPDCPPYKIEPMKFLPFVLTAIGLLVLVAEHRSAQDEINHNRQRTLKMLDAVARDSILEGGTLDFIGLRMADQLRGHGYPVLWDIYSQRFQERQ